MHAWQHLYTDTTQLKDKAEAQCNMLKNVSKHISWNLKVLNEVGNDVKS